MFFASLQGVGGLDYSHDVPGPSGIDFAIINALWGGEKGWGIDFAIIDALGDR